ncbi:hypothetical protein Agub_g13177, partial [Astrephomene gubernaculifera]
MEDPSSRGGVGSGASMSGGRGFFTARGPAGTSARLSTRSSYDESVHGSFGHGGLQREGATRDMRFAGSALAEVPFFADVPSHEAALSVTVVRALCLSKAAWELLAEQFPHQARIVLDNLQSRHEAELFSALHSAASSSQLSPAQLETAISLMKAEEGIDSMDPQLLVETRAALTQAQMDQLLRLDDIRAVVRAHVHKVDSLRTYRFLQQAALGDVDTLRNMLNQGMSPNSADYDGRTGLMLAAKAGHEGVVRLLLDHGAKADQLDAFGNSALTEACKAGNDKEIELLLNYGASLGVNSLQVAGTMCTAVFEGDLIKLRRLLRAGAPPDACDYDRRSALHIAGAEGNLAAVKLLIQEGGADPNFQDRWGNTALDEARRVGAEPVVVYLEGLESQERLALSDEQVRRQIKTELLTACTHGDVARITRLFAASRPPCVHTALLVAAAEGQPGAVQALIKWTSGRVLERVGHVALLEAADMGHVEVVRLLRAAGASLPDPAADTNVAVLEAAVLRHDLPVVAALLAAGVHVMPAGVLKLSNTTTTRVCTPLAEGGDGDASGGGEGASADAAIGVSSSNISPNTRGVILSGSGGARGAGTCTALHLAAGMGNLDLVRLLVEVGGASARAPDTTGASAASLAERAAVLHSGSAIHQRVAEYLSWAAAQGEEVDPVVAVAKHGPLPDVSSSHAAAAAAAQEEAEGKKKTKKKKQEDKEKKEKKKGVLKKSDASSSSDSSGDSEGQARSKRNGPASSATAIIVPPPSGSTTTRTLNSNASIRNSLRPSTSLKRISSVRVLLQASAPPGPQTAQQSQSYAAAPSPGTPPGAAATAPKLSGSGADDDPDPADYSRVPIYDITAASAGSCASSFAQPSSRRSSQCRRVSLWDAGGTTGGTGGGGQGPPASSPLPRLSEEISMPLQAERQPPLLLPQAPQPQQQQQQQQQGQQGQPSPLQQGQSGRLATQTLLEQQQPSLQRRMSRSASRTVGHSRSSLGSSLSSSTRSTGGGGAGGGGSSASKGSILVLSPRPASLTSQQQPQQQQQQPQSSLPDLLESETEMELEPAAGDGLGVTAAKSVTAPLGAGLTSANAMAAAAQELRRLEGRIEFPSVGPSVRWQASDVISGGASGGGSGGGGNGEERWSAVSTASSIRLGGQRSGLRNAVSMPQLQHPQYMQQQQQQQQHPAAAAALSSSASPARPPSVLPAGLPGAVGVTEDGFLAAPPAACCAEDLLAGSISPAALSRSSALSAAMSRAASSIAMPAMAAATPAAGDVGFGGGSGGSGGSGSYHLLGVQGPSPSPPSLSVQRLRSRLGELSATAGGGGSHRWSEGTLGCGGGMASVGSVSVEGGGYEGSWSTGPAVMMAAGQGGIGVGVGVGSAMTAEFAVGSPPAASLAAGSRGSTRSNRAGSWGSEAVPMLRAEVGAAAGAAGGAVVGSGTGAGGPSLSQSPRGG